MTLGLNTKIDNNVDKRTNEYLWGDVYCEGISVVEPRLSVARLGRVVVLDDTDWGRLLLLSYLCTVETFGNVSRIPLL